MTIHPFPAPKAKGSVQDKIERLADSIASDALAGDVPLATRLDALKSLTAWGIAANKIKPPEPDETPFERMAAQIEAASKAEPEPEPEDDDEHG